jgi:hypothetical protein
MKHVMTTPPLLDWLDVEQDALLGQTLDIIAQEGLTPQQPFAPETVLMEL